MFEIYRRLKWAYQKFKLSYSLPFIVLVSYTLVGAVLFRQFELEPDEQRREDYRRATEYAFNQVLARMTEIRCHDSALSGNQSLQSRHTKDALSWLIDYLNLTQVIEKRSEPSPWTWMGSAFYAGQLYTTIGYGMPATETTAGRITSIFYILIGIPVFLIILKDVGKLLSKGLRKLYKRVQTAKDKLPEAAARRMSEPVKIMLQATMSLNQAIYNLSGGTSNGGPTSSTPASPIEKTVPADVDLEAQMFNLDKHGPEPETDPQKQNELNEQLHKKDKRFPIPWALSILMLWILFSAAMFCLWETEWGYLTSIYFFFVSISTVGLGDIVPEKPDMMLVNFVLILIGLALLSMCVDLVQAAIERMLQQLLEEYIQEIEKIAQVVSGGEEFSEEAATPFEVGMTEMLTVPLTSVADQRSGRLMSIGRSAKDWVAGKIASNLLISRLDPYHSSDSEEESEGEAEAVEYLNEGVSVDEMPKIAIHEGTPLRTLEDVRKISIGTRDSGSNASVTRRNRHKPAKAHAHLNYNKPTLRAIQVIETAKLRTGRDDNMRSRVFAKFATNSRLAKFVDNRIEPPKPKMVTCSVQTTPVAQRKVRLMGETGDPHCALESPDTLSSDAADTQDSPTTYDADSLCSNAYLDMKFGYETDSVPVLMAQQNTPLSARRKSFTTNVEVSHEELEPESKTRPKLPPLQTQRRHTIQDTGSISAVEFVTPSTMSQATGTAPLILLELDSPDVDGASTSSAQTPGTPTLRRTLSQRITSRERKGTTLLTPTSLLPLPHARIPMVKCPSCLHVAAAPSAGPTVSSSGSRVAAGADDDVLHRVQAACGIMPSDFTASSSSHGGGHHKEHPSDEETRRESPRLDDSGYECSQSAGTREQTASRPQSILLDSGLSDSINQTNGGKALESVQQLEADGEEDALLRKTDVLKRSDEVPKSPSSK